jgi:hypothetical protein
MTMRYAHLAPERLRAAVSVLDDIQLGALKQVFHGTASSPRSVRR